MIKVFFVRHGRTKWNREEVFRGCTDIPLDEIGKKEAYFVGNRLRQERITEIYTSPLSRAKKTAEIIASFHNLEVRVLPGLKDLDFGEWEGMYYKDVKEKYPQLYEKWLYQPHKVLFPKGEGLQEVHSRVIKTIDYIVSQNLEGVIVVSHRVVLKVMICALLCLDNSHFWQIVQDTGAINCFLYQNGIWIVTLLNDLCHLGGIRKVKGKVDF